MFQLPPGYRPAPGKIVRVAAECACGVELADPQGGVIDAPVTTAGVVVERTGFGAGADGAVVPDSGVQFPSGGGGWISLDGITFRAGS